ncbi:hypothetical protein BFJ69_g3165 [Fusarium oxysporum]|uniref:Uncharacterized protein n=1 Tax=Fusarium oxysporum TaxID=5507 RepID=A0A420Q443_FUSOX|nr:hypothetical protein BFJ69_g3165 [Fusarium oxysporum]RKK99534.1 hypothetical protein BFJ71_g6129 [Fusarium oxysporum]
MAVVLFRTSTLQPTLRHQHISQQATLYCDTSVGNKVAKSGSASDCTP